MTKQLQLIDVPLRQDELDQWFTRPPLATRLARWALSPLGELLAQGAPITILEPSAGNGALVAALLSELGSYTNVGIVAIEVDPKHAEVLRLRFESEPRVTVCCGDFLDDAFLDSLGAGGIRIDLAFMNPPFSDDRDLAHVARAALMARRVVSQVRANFLLGLGRYDAIWSKHDLTRQINLSSRPSYAGIKDGSPRHDFVVVELERRQLIQQVPASRPLVEWWLV